MNSAGWLLSDLPNPKSGAPKAFSCFACGGGSSMGYRTAGFDVIGANDIDPDMMGTYRANLGKEGGGLYLECPVGEVAERSNGLLDGIDVLDGSPPCSTFSMAGLRDRAWGRKKKFREGQSEQVLDRLFFDFIDQAAAIRPKVVVAENVAGMLGGKARAYADAVVQSLRRIGYGVQVALLNAADHGTPQFRRRVFFVARRNDLKLPRLEWPKRDGRKTVLDATAGMPKGGSAPKLLGEGTAMRRAWEMTNPGLSLKSGSGHLVKFNTMERLSPYRVSPALTASGSALHWSEPRYLSRDEIVRLGGFPDDYDFCEGRRDVHSRAAYVVGMSVPPPLMGAVAGEIMRQWFR